jgi:hypothetical protein
MLNSNLPNIPRTFILWNSSILFSMQEGRRNLPKTILPFYHLILYRKVKFFDVPTKRLVIYLDLLWHPPDRDLDPYWETPTGIFELKIRRYIIAEFYRKKLNPDFPLARIPPIHCELRRLVQKEMLLWNGVLNLLKYLSSCQRITGQSPEHLLYQLVNERALVLLMFGNRSGTKIIKAQQLINHELQSCKNPFSREKHPQTWLVVKQAINLESKGGDFAKDFYRPIYEARMDVISEIMAQKPTTYKQGKPEYRGKCNHDGHGK